MTFFVNLLGALIVIPLLLMLVCGICWLIFFIVFEVICGYDFTGWCAKKIISIVDSGKRLLGVED